MPRPAVDDPLNRQLLIRAALVGLGAGFLSGLFGVGGGILMVPALVMVMHLDQRLAHGTSLAAVVPIAVSSTLSYAVAGEVDWTVAAFLAIGAIGGAVLGTRLLHTLPERVLGWAFAALLIATALRMLFDQGDAAGRAPLSAVGAVALVVTGLASGVLAGLLGVGGGIIMVPVMVVGFDMSAALSKGTSLAVIIPTAVMGTWRNWRKGNVAMATGVVAGLAGMISAFGAGMISVGMSDALSNGLFAALLVVVATRMIWQLWSEREVPEPDPV